MHTQLNTSSHKNLFRTQDCFFVIASAIAEKLGFQLNRGNPNPDPIRYSPEDVLAVEFHSKMLFHKELSFSAELQKAFWPLYTTPIIVIARAARNKKRKLPDYESSSRRHSESRQRRSESSRRHKIN